jgi:hypothetical protein
MAYSLMRTGINSERSDLFNWDRVFYNLIVSIQIMQNDGLVYSTLRNHCYYFSPEQAFTDLLIYL